MAENKISILFPNQEAIVYKELSESTRHDLGLETLCKNLSNQTFEQNYIMSVIGKMTDNPNVARFRSEVFGDIYRLKDMRSRMMELLDKVKFLKEFGSFKRDGFRDKDTGLWDLLHRLDEINEYIECVEAITECLKNEDIYSEGLKNLRDYVEQIYVDAEFAALKEDVKAIKKETDSIKSVTIGINVNERFEANSIGLISVNSKPFKSSNIVSNFSEALFSQKGIKDNTDWNGDMHYHAADQRDIAGIPVITKINEMNMAKNNQIAAGMTGSTIASIPQNDAEESSTRYLNRVATQMLNRLSKRLQEVLSKYVKITIGTITDLIPEFVYYIRFAEYIEQMTEKGRRFCTATVISDADSNQGYMQAKGIYNFKLAGAVAQDETIVTNDFYFDKEHMCYILTGANRGGKTTITQAVGILYVLAQGGISIPGDSFSYIPVDCIYTHFPADEDKTMDLGRLGEECSRFKEMYKECTSKSLLLMNETFSTTSFEEGYYIAKDAVKAILQKGIKTIYNTHMHKLAYDIVELNNPVFQGKASSLVVKADGGKRSFKVEVAEPEGFSYAKDIAEKYGVTFDMLTKQIS